jgi:hypothetical protein
MKLRLCSLALAFFACAPLTIFADIPAPEPKPTATPQTGKRVLPPARMSIESRKGITEARLQISQSVLRQLRAEIEGDAATDAATAFVNSPRRTQTILAGLFLSLSLAFAGVFIVRSRSRTSKQIATGALVVFAVAGALTFKAFANIRPPEMGVNAGSLPRATTPDAELNGVVRVEIVPEGRAIKLIVPATTERR